MKNKWNRVIALLLIVASLLSVFSILTFADAPKVALYYNRDFDEGWEYTNGVTAVTNGNKFEIDHEFNANFDYNYFLRVNALTTSVGYLKIPISTPVADGGTVVQIDLRLAGECDLGDVLSATTAGGVNYSLAAIREGDLFLFGQGNAVASLSDTAWTKLTYFFDWSSRICDVMITSTSGSTSKLSYDLDPTAKGANITEYRLGVPGRATAEPMAYCVDNLRVYNDAVTILSDEEVNALGAGSLVNKNADTPVIPTGATVKSQKEYIMSGVVMKTRCDWMLLGGQRTAIYTDEETGVLYGAPQNIGGVVYIPLDIVLQYLGYTYYIHPDGQSYDVATGHGATTYIAVGRDSAVVAGETIRLTAAPAYIKKTIDGKDYAYLGIAMNDVESLFNTEGSNEKQAYITYDDMGLIILCEKKDVLTREEKNGLTTMCDYMKKFIFDLPTGAQIREDVKKNTNNYDHPYLYANQERFDVLRAIYQAKDAEEYAQLCEENETLDKTAYNEKIHRYLTNYVKNSFNNLVKYAELDEFNNYVYKNEYKVTKGGEEYTYTLGIGSSYFKGFENSYYEYYPQYNDGYDDGGRCSPVTGVMMDMAFAYQITGDVRYAQLVYDRLIILGMWEHWGPTHFLNCADATDPAGTAFDWAYDGFVEAGLDPYIVAKLIYDNGVYEGYLSIVERRCEHTIPRMMSGWDWLDNWDNWNAVCNSGMTIGSLALMQYDAELAASTAENAEFTSGTVNTMVAHRTADFSNCIDKQMTAIMPHMCLNGLIEYCPDGSYYESATYWGYGTNNLFQMAAALYSAAGTDYGIMDGWGLDKTCYFAAHSESSDYMIWNYHDASGSGGSQSTEWFNFAGMILEDEGLIELRQYQLKNGKGMTIWDVIYFRTDLDALEFPTLDLSYCSKGMDGWMCRSSWEKGSIYACIIGGDNDVAHGDLDSGGFIYYRYGKAFIWDIGCDNYNTYSFFGTSGPRWCHYMEGAEGQNIVFMTSEQQDTALRYGQDPWKGWGDMYATAETGYGAYALINNQSVYGGYTTYARRGMLFTNNRQTVVVQDEIQFKGMESVVWNVHIRPEAQLKFSEDGRRVYITMNCGDVWGMRTIRGTIVSTNPLFKFIESDCYDFQLDATYRRGQSLELGGTQDENNREGWKRLMIKTENALFFNCAVVFEEIKDPKEDTTEVSYEWVDMAKWNPVAPVVDPDAPIEEDPKEQDPEEDLTIMTPAISHIMNYTQIYEKLVGDNTNYGEKIGDAYAALVAVYRAGKAYKVNTLSSTVKKAYEKYQGFKSEYDDFIEQINTSQKQIESTGTSLMGLIL